jgi:HK97 family phage prohead protease
MEKMKRYLDVFSKAEARAAADGKMYLEGTIPFNSISEDLGWFKEVISPTAFNQTLSLRSNVYAFWAHDEADVLASTDAGSLALSVDSIGLHFSAELRADCADYFAAVQRGDVVGVSFGFICQKEEWDYNQEPALRTLKEVQLLEVSPGVAFPAYAGAQSDAVFRSLRAEAPLLADQRAQYRSMTKTEPKPEPEPKAESLEPTPEQRDALESRDQAEIAILRAKAALA